MCPALRAMTLLETRGQPSVWVHQEKITRDGAVWGQGHNFHVRPP